MTLPKHSKGKGIENEVGAKEAMPLHHATHTSHTGHIHV